MLEILSTAVIALDKQGCVQTMNAAAEHCLATTRTRACGEHFRDFEGISVALLEALTMTAGDQRSRHLRECKMAGGWYGCSLQPIAEECMLLEFHDLKWQRQQSNLQQRELQTGMLDLLRRNNLHLLQFR